jgi:hypothetical protein
MPFRLCNAPGIFQSYINNFLLKYLDIFYIIYLDNVLVYSNNKENYTKSALFTVDLILQHNISQFLYDRILSFFLSSLSTFDVSLDCHVRLNDIIFFQCV